MPIRWRAWLMSVFGSSKSTPSTLTLPELGCSNLFRQRSSVDLPEPDGPMTNTSSRSATTRSTPFRTCRAPKCLWMPRASTTGLVTRDPYDVRNYAISSSPPRKRGPSAFSAALQRMRRRVVARHARHAIAGRDHALERIGARCFAEPLLGHLGDGAVLLHAIEHVLHLVAQRDAVLAERRRPVRPRVGELEVGDELRVLF